MCALTLATATLHSSLCSLLAIHMYLHTKFIIHIHIYVHTIKNIDKDTRYNKNCQILVLGGILVFLVWYGINVALVLI